LVPALFVLGSTDEYMESYRITITHGGSPGGNIGSIGDTAKGLVSNRTGSSAGIPQLLFCCEPIGKLLSDIYGRARSLVCHTLPEISTTSHRKQP
jgi:hypothetical protein